MLKCTRLSLLSTYSCVVFFPLFLLKQAQAAKKEVVEGKLTRMR